MKTLTSRNFELTNHLGNVLTTLTDAKLATATNTYTATVTNAQDYYPFGMAMNGRGTGANGYRFGYNGKEKTDEIEGSGNSYDYGARMLDARIGRFLSLDPLNRKYPELTPYQFASNTSIWAIDLDGKEAFYQSDGTKVRQIGTSTQVKLVNDDFADKIKNAKAEELNLHSSDVGMNEAELNVRATLATLKQAEAGFGKNNKPNPSLEYNSWNGKDKFTEDSYEDNPGAYSDHPGQNKNNKNKTAAGAYQFMKDYWDGKDFSPETQDKAAISKKYMGTKGLKDAKDGKIIDFKKDKSGTWTSLKNASDEQLSTEFKKNISKELTGKSKIATPKGQLLTN